MRVPGCLVLGGLLILLSAPPVAGQTTFATLTAKQFDLRGGMRLRWELTATNVLNTANYSNPGVNISSLAQVGVISDIGDVSDLDPTGPRSLRMGLRVEW